MMQTPTVGWLVRAIHEAADEHATGDCGSTCRYCAKFPEDDYQCPTCGLYADEDQDEIEYGNAHTYYTDYGTANGWCEKVQCHRCGTIYEYNNGDL